MGLTTWSGRPLVIGTRLAKGGQGEIFSVAEPKGLVFKRPFDDVLAADPTLGPRLRLMVMKPPRQWREERSRHILLSWPSDVVLNNGRFAGFLMPRIDVGQTVELHEIANPSSRREFSPSHSWTQGFSWEYLVATAANLSVATDILHETGVVIGDFNERNILVRDDARVTLLDCDSMQISDRATNKWYLCGVGRPEFTAPELLGADWKTTVRSSSSDLFALAIHLHQLLLEGAHPFDGVWTGSGEKPKRHHLARDAMWVYGGDSRLSPRPSAPSIDMLSPEVVALFKRAFLDGAVNPRNRPRASEWSQELKRLQGQLQKCSKGASHVYRKHLTKCPWCERDSTRTQVPLPPAAGTVTVIQPPPPVIVSFPKVSSQPFPTSGSSAVGTMPAPTAHALNSPQPPTVVLASPSPQPAAPTVGGTSSVSTGDRVRAVFASVLILLLGGFGTGIFLDRESASAALLARVAVVRVDAYLVFFAVLCGAVVILGAGRRSATAATAAVVAGAVAIGGGWPSHLGLPDALTPKLPDGASSMLFTIATQLGGAAVVAAIACGLIALGLAVCLHRLLSATSDTPGSDLRGSRRALHAVLPLVILGLVAGGAVAKSKEANDIAAASGNPASTDVWIAQLASVAYTDGEESLGRALSEVRNQVPEARVLRTDDFLSYDPGYWVVYADEGFTTGAEVLSFCDSRGRTTRNTCIGHFLTVDAPDQTRICLRNDDGVLSEDC